MNPFLYYVWRKNSCICIEADFCDILVEEFSEWYEEVCGAERVKSNK